MNKPLKSNTNHDNAEIIKAQLVVSDKIKIPCAIGRRRPVYAENIAQAENQLLWARALHYKGHHREAFQTAVLASIDLFDAVGGDLELQEPLRHLFYSLLDLDQGTQDKALLATKFGNNPPLSNAEWTSRAYLAAALEARIKVGQRKLVAAEDICKKFQQLLDRRIDIDAKNVIQWRKDFREGKNTLGECAWKQATEKLAEILEIRQEWLRDEALSQFEARALNEAEKWKGRITSPK